VNAAFYLKKRQGTCRDFSFLAILQTWRTQQLKNHKRTTVPNNSENFSKQLTIIIEGLWAKTS